MNKQVANLQLNTINGVLTGNNNSCTWNVDMSKVLGDLWDKYEYFNLTLKCIAWNILPADGTTNGSDNSSQLNRYFMKGLEWENCNYDCLTSSIKDRTCIGSARCSNAVSSNTGLIYYFPSKYVVNTFRKSTSIVDINIFIINNYTAILGVLGTTGGRNFPHTIYDFSITACEDYSETTALLTLIPSVNANNGSTQIFNNVNFDLLLGKLRSKYDNFSVELVELQSSYFATLVLNANSRVAYVEIEGLQPVNNDNDERVVLGDVYFDITRGLTYFNSSNNVLNGFADEVNNTSIVKFSNRNTLTINFKSIETKNLITITSGSMASTFFQILIRPIT
jgi:hypothetical protein